LFERPEAKRVIQIVELRNLQTTTPEVIQQAAERLDVALDLGVA
jgi:hypothetical protein